MRKYPRTQHLQGSTLQDGDEDLDQVSFDDLNGHHVVVEEKVDGGNCGLSFSDGQLMLQSRGHYLAGGPREAQFALLKQWAPVHVEDFRDILEDRYILYGEWLFAKHTVFYNNLPHYLLEYDVYDKQKDAWLATEARKELLLGLPIVHVQTLFQGKLESMEQLLGMLSTSHYVVLPELASDFAAAVRDSGQEVGLVEQQSDVSGTMEGLYIKVEENGQVVQRLKWVRHGFLQRLMSSGSHWHDRPIVRNKLGLTADIWAK